MIKICGKKKNILKFYMNFSETDLIHEMLEELWSVL